MTWLLYADMREKKKDLERSRGRKTRFKEVMNDNKEAVCRESEDSLEKGKRWIDIPFEGL